MMSDENSGDKIDPTTGEVVSEAKSREQHGNFRISAKMFKREYLEVPEEFLDLVGSSEEKQPLLFKDLTGNQLILDLWPRLRRLGGLGEWYRTSGVSPEDSIFIECLNREEKLFSISVERSRTKGEHEGLYLGKQYYMLGSTKRELTRRYLLPETDLLTHVFICGVTGSGKTVLGKALIEEAALRSIPSIVIDLKGDLSSIAIKFDSLNAEEFAPWVEARDEGERKVVAEKEARKHREKLGEFEVDYKSVKDFGDKVEVRIFTPRSSKGIPLAFSSPLAAPTDATDLYVADRETFNNLVASLTNAFIDRLYPNVKRVRIENERNYVYEIVHHCWRHEIDLGGQDGLFELLRLCQDPPFTEIGGLPVDQYITAENRKARLLNKINTVLSGPETMWFEGNPLSVETQFLSAEGGKTPISVINLTDLDSFEDRSFVVAQIAYEIYKWMRKQPGTSKPRLVFFIDEIGGGGGRQAFFPSFPYECAAKWGLNYLLRQGRAYGVCCVFATQNPGDIDYRALSNCGTWISGKLATDRDRQKVLEGMAIGGSELERVKRNLANADIGDFVVKDARGEMQYVKERWLMTYHRVLTMHEVRKLTEQETLKKKFTSAPAQDNESVAKPVEAETGPGSRSVEDLISDIEDERAEFKSSARWNVHKKGRDAAIELGIIKTVAGFMNANGGALLIGVDDSGRAIGLENDFQLFKKNDRNRDAYGLWLITLLETCIGKPATVNLKVSFASVEGKNICRVDVRPSKRPVFVNVPGSQKTDDFYVRIGASTRRLSTDEALQYVKDHWG